ncbi:redox-regulated ATPase YchF [Patescibacteria group bacterium]|nr:redox-regulated ATPase YchF [Patescibacteria group bacterium]
MSFAVGIIGLPNVGKSTLFKALTKKQVDISNYPFTTIEPNVGMVKVPDDRLDKLAAIIKPQKTIPTHIEFVDIAGLVKNAHQGEGLGNQFLAQIREVKAIIHLVRVFADRNIAHVSGEIHPETDIDTVNLELMMADQKTIAKRLEEVIPKANTGEKEALAIKPVLLKLKDQLNVDKLINCLDLSIEERLQIQDLHLLTAKPILYVLNVEEARRQQQFKLATDQPLQIIAMSAKLESELADLSEAEIQELGFSETGLTKLIKGAHQLLDLITFFTAENDILQAWTLAAGQNAQQAAGAIHTDFAEGFIKADVINCQDLFKSGDLKKAHDLGLIKTVGKEYPVQDGDLIKFKFKN